MTDAPINEAPDSEAAHISWSLGETAALATKAARGAGMPWGLADEAGFAVGWLHARGMPGVAALCRYLHWRDAGGLAVWPHAPNSDQFYCPITVGAAFMDGAIAVSTTITSLREPLLLLPFIGERAGATPLEVRLNDTVAYVSQNGVAGAYVDIRLLVSSANCDIRQPATGTVATDVAAIKRPQDGRRVASCHFACMQTLQLFAKRTYAPATEASRLAGAGAGLNDND